MTMARIVPGIPRMIQRGLFHAWETAEPGAHWNDIDFAWRLLHYSLEKASEIYNGTQGTTRT